MKYQPHIALIGGPDVHLRIELLDHLREWFDFTVFGSNPALARTFSDSGYKYVPYKLSRSTNLAVDLQGVGQLARALRRIRPDMVHAFATKPSIWGRLAARMAGVPLIVGTLPGLGALYAGEDRKSRLLRSIYQPLQRTVCHFSDLTIFQNYGDAEQFLRAGVVPRHKAKVVVSSGVCTKRFHPERVSQEERCKVRSELGIQPDEVVVTMVSRVNRIKGALEFAAAARALQPDYPYVRFLLVGPADGSTGNLTAAEMEELRTTVTWPGARKDIPAVMAISDLFVLPTAYREGVPRVLMEAASMGLPLVTTDIPGCDEVVKHGINGLLVPLHDTAALTDAIRHLLDHPQLRRRLGANSRRHAVEHFEISLVAHQIHTIYDQLLATNAHASHAHLQTH